MLLSVAFVLSVSSFFIQVASAQRCNNTGALVCCSQVYETKNSMTTIITIADPWANQIMAGPLWGWNCVNEVTSSTRSSSTWPTASASLIQRAPVFPWYAFDYDTHLSTYEF
ncbi:hypothetical protein CPC08DRAFT_135496 [Agrocybe pediades]|nr:hypothetical protein CPC08DRAFT_135496 [Agrocybe pediades]